MQQTLAAHHVATSLVEVNHKNPLQWHAFRFHLTTARIYTNTPVVSTYTCIQLVLQRMSLFVGLYIYQGFFISFFTSSRHLSFELNGRKPFLKLVEDIPVVVGWCPLKRNSSARFEIMSEGGEGRRVDNTFAAWATSLSCMQTYRRFPCLEAVPSCTCTDERCKSSPSLGCLLQFPFWTRNVEIIKMLLHFISSTLYSKLLTFANFKQICWNYNLSNSHTHPYIYTTTHVYVHLSVGI